MYTMKRWQPAFPSSLFARPRWAPWLLAALCAATALAGAPAAAQNTVQGSMGGMRNFPDAALAGAPAAAQNTVQGSMGGMRNFPDAALRGSLVITAASEAEIN